MKAPVGLLSDRTVLRQQDGGASPRQVPVCRTSCLKHKPERSSLFRVDRSGFYVILKIVLCQLGFQNFIRTVLATDCADLIDIEFFTAGAELPALIEEAHTAGAAVVCSSHDFHKTPPRAELVSRMVAMQQAGADLPKLAVMPQSRADVLELLAATAEMADRHPETPIITMSMGALGAVSRLSGEALGSAMTFANPGQASAPGQVSLEVVNEVLDALHL